MKNIANRHSGGKSWIAGVMAFLSLVNGAYAQIPKGVPQPHQNEPISSFSEVLFYIIIPIILVITYIIWRRQVKKRKEKAEMEEDQRDQEEKSE